ncbi:hypothetical protein HMPREF9466_02267 [Fusobacterium necrophorum subsp. funduliforme 1_1_36S]|nr:hypothetical protein HMPREF9466_02267 [Fusobacterium necrophorum subsp. funduliforme 1_1_36S]
MKRKWIITGLLGISLLVQAAEIREIQTIDQLLQEEIAPVVEIQKSGTEKSRNKDFGDGSSGKKSDREKDRRESKRREQRKERKERNRSCFERKKVIPEKVQAVKEIKTPETKNIAEKPTKAEKVSQTVKEDTYLAGLVADTKGNIYYSKNIDKKLPMASVTKVMTLLVTFDAIRNGEAHLEDKVVITKDVYNKGGSGISMKPGETFTLLDLIRATAIYSANNAAYAVAKHIGKGSISNFIKK